VALLDWGAPDWGTPPYRVPGESGPTADWRGWNEMVRELLNGQTGPGRDVPRLIGREVELARLREYWQQAARSEAIWVGISAPSGGGKTALLEEMLGWSPHAVLARCSTLTSPLGYQLFQSLLEQAGWPLEGQGLRELAWQQFQASFPGVRSDPGKPAPGTAMTPVLLSEAWATILSQRAGCWPLLVLLDDVQWTDSATRQLLEVLSHRPIPGLMVALAWRESEWTPPEGLELRAVIPLPPLQAQHVAQWSQRDGVMVNTQQAEQMAHWSGGNPLLIGEWLRKPEQPVFSAKVGGLLRQRIQQVPSAYLPTLQLAALMGSEFQAQPLATQGPWQQALAWAEEQQLLLPGLRFSHDQVREALLETMNDEQRQSWHRRLGDCFAQANPVDSGCCAYHYWHSDEPHRSAPFALLAARRELPRSALSAAQYYDIFCQSHVDPAVVLEFSQALELLGQHEAAIGWLKVTLSKAENRSWASEIHLRISRHAYASGQHSKAYFHASQAWAKRHRQGSPNYSADQTVRLLHTELEAVFTLQQQGEVLKVLARRLPLAAAATQDLQLQSSLMVALNIFRFPVPRYLRYLMMRRIHRERDPLLRAKAWVRCASLHFGEGDGRFHERILHYLASTFEELGHPWEPYMIYTQLGMYAMVRGDFSHLRRWANRLQELSQISHDSNPAAVAIHFSIYASGGRVAKHLLPSQEPLGQGGLMNFHLQLARARYLLGRGQPEQAWESVEKSTSLIPLDRALIETYKATAARSWADSVPRRWKLRRQELYGQARDCAQKALTAGSMARMWFARARREMALALVGLGRSQEALQCMTRSIEEAVRFEASYEEALSRQAWGRVGPGLGWHSCPQQARQGQQMLEHLGAWWDLSSESAGLPLDEVSQDASQYLENPDPHCRERLARWVETTWIDQLDEVRYRAKEFLKTRERYALQLHSQQMRWQALLQNGPLGVQRFAADGSPLEGRSPSHGMEHRVELTEGEYAVVTLPLERAQFSQCKQLLQAEVNDLSRLLRDHRREAQNLPPGELATMLLENCTALEQWHLGSQPVQWREAWFGRHLQVEQQGDIPWDQLGLEARTALLGVLREALQNCRKHCPETPVQLGFRRTPRELLVSIVSAPPARPGPSSPRSFGLESMRFRATLAGGRVQLGENYSVRLWLPLLAS